MTAPASAPAPTVTRDSGGRPVPDAADIREIATQTLLTHDQARLCLIVALDLADTPARAVQLVTQAAQPPWNALSTLVVLHGWKDAAANHRQPLAPAPPHQRLTAEQTRHITARLAGLLYEAGYSAGASAALRAGFDGGRAANAYLLQCATEISRYEQQAELVNAALGRPDGYAYIGGPVHWDTGLPAIPGQRKENPR